MHTICLLVSFISSIVGSICGVGGGVIIKPVLDTVGIMSVSTISFLSGCTVLSMSVVSVLQSRKDNVQINMKTSTPLAIGAVAGGIFGKMIFDLLRFSFGHDNILGAIQALVMLLITGGAYLYTVYTKKIKTHTTINPLVCIALGLLLGVLSSFLGIGGGPINLCVLWYFFSMDSKEASINSLYVIMYSQAAALIYAFINRTIPGVETYVMLLMICGGIGGAAIGRIINKRISVQHVTQLFRWFMLMIMVLNIYNMINFLFCKN